jgi:hypothetical protein
MAGLRGVWSILDPVTINVDAPPDICLPMLSTAARPSTERLHLRDTFTEGRRYFIDPTAGGFRMATTSKTLFNRRRRTESLTILNARVIPTGDGRTSIAIHARMRLLALVSTLWIPVGMVLLLWPVPWPRVLTVFLLSLMFGFAWASLRYGAALEANEMLFFIQKTFEDVPKFQLAGLPEHSQTIIGANEFDAMWEQFVRARQNET